MAVSPEMDLAVLTIGEEKKAAFFRDRKAVSFAKAMPKIQDELLMYGYPVGGNALRPIGGTLSRIEYTSYDYDGTGLRMEVNAAINPGASGGPAFRAGAEGELIGLVSGYSPQGESIGYVIPVEEIRTFLEDVQDSKYDGKPDLPVLVQALENPALRAKLQLPEQLHGVLVREVEQPADASLQMDDIITHIGETPIDNVGMIQLPGTDFRVAYSYLVPELSENGTVPLTIFREGAARKIDVPVTTPRQRLIPNLKGGHPEYFVWGPLCFSTASGELVDSLSPYLSSLWSFHGSPLASRRTDFLEGGDEELVIITTVFPHRLMRGYGSPTGNVVSKINGKPVSSLRRLVKMLRQANEKEEEFVEFEFADRHVGTLVFDRLEVQRSMEELLTDNGIRQIGTADLVSVWNSANAEGRVVETTD